MPSSYVDRSTEDAGGSAKGRLAILRAGGLCIAIALLAPTGSAVAGEWRLTPAIGVNETFTDNDDLNPNGRKNAALITQVTPSLSVRGTGARLNLALNTSLDFRYKTLDKHETELNINLAGTGSAELLQDLFFVDAAASVSQEALNDRAATSASRANTQNLSTVQTYSISPYLRHRLGNFADLEERYTLVRVSESGDTISDSISQSVTLRVSGGRDFTQLRWTVSALAKNDNESDDADEQERRADLDLEYIVSRQISIIGGAGYEKFNLRGDSADTEGPTWRAGLSLRPGPRTDIRGTFGRRFDGEDIQASLRYRITSRTSLSADVTTSLDEPQDRTARDLSFIGVDDQGNLIDTRTGQPFNANTSVVGLSNERQRTTTVNVGLNATRGRNTFNVSSGLQKEEGVFSGVEDNSVFVNAAWGRQLNRRANLNVSGRYENSEFGADDREDNEYTFTANLAYRVFDRASATLSYAFRRRDSTSTAGEFTENAVSLGMNFRF